MVSSGVSYMSESSCDRIWSARLPGRASGRNDWHARSLQWLTVEIPGANSTWLRADLPVSATHSDDSESARPLHAGGGFGACGSHDDRPLGAPHSVSGRVRQLVHPARGACATDSGYFG